MFSGNLPLDNWWTPIRVRAMLANYQALVSAIDGVSAVAYKPYESHASPPSEAGFADAIQRKADIDRTIAKLPARLRRVAVVYWCEGGDTLNIGHELRVTERHAWRYVAEAQAEITRRLCEGAA